MDAGRVGIELGSEPPGRLGAKDWLRRPTPDVVTLDVAAMTDLFEFLAQRAAGEVQAWSAAHPRLRVHE